MKVITNEDLIAKRKKWANILAPTAMILLLAGLAANFASLRSEEITPFYFYLTLTLLFFGFILSSISSNLVTRWVKEPRADQVLEKALKGFDNKTALLNYTSRSPHVLITQNKVYAITTKGLDGEIDVSGLKWKRKFQASRLLRFFAQESLGNPSLEAQRNAEKLANHIQENLSAPDESLIVEPIIVFTHPDVQLSVNDSPIPVLKSSVLKKFIKEELKGTAMNAKLRQELIDLLT